MISKPGAAAFQKNINGQETGLFWLRNTNGIQVAITNYGARIVSLVVPDNKERETDVVVGFDSIDGYLNATEVYHAPLKEDH